MGNNHKPGGFDWGNMEKFLSEQIPFLPKEYLKNRPMMNASWVGDYVQEIMKKSFGESPLQGSGEEPADKGVRVNAIDFEHEMFETHNSVIVRVKLPEDVHYKNIRVYAASNQVKLEKEPSRQKQYIRLPHPVDAGTAKGIYKDGILELRMTKISEAEMYQEIRIRSQ